MPSRFYFPEKEGMPKREGGRGREKQVGLEFVDQINLIQIDIRLIVKFNGLIQHGGNAE